MKKQYPLLALLFTLVLLVTGTVHATTYYVSATAGQLNRTRAQAINPNTPWLRIQQACDSAAAGDTIWVAPGEYQESDTIRKTLTLLGNGGTGTKPLINTPLVAGMLGCFVVRARNVEIKNFEMRFNQIYTIYGINAEGNNVWSGLKVTDCQIASAGTGAPCFIFNSYGIYATGNNDTITIQRNRIGALDPTLNCIPGRAIWLTNCRATIGGPSPADSNVCTALYSIQSATVRGSWRVMNNKLYGIGFLLNSPTTDGATQYVMNNEFYGMGGAPIFALLEIRAGTNRNGRIWVKGNKFLEFGQAAIFSGRARNVVVDSNEFYPANADAIAVHFNTKFQTNGTGFNAFRNGGTVIGNKFYGPMNGDTSTMAIGIYNHNAVARDTSFSDFNIGGVGRNANWFAHNIKLICYLDTNARQSVAFPLWTTYPITNMAPVRANVNLANNLFEVTPGVTKAPAQMTVAEHFALENRLYHRGNDPRVGIISQLPNTAYVTTMSKADLLGTVPSINRSLTALTDGGTLWVEQDTLNEVVRTAVTATIQKEAGQSLTLKGVRMTAANKVLTLAPVTTLTDSLQLTAGRLNLMKPTTLKRQSGWVGGSANSFLTFDGGRLIIPAFSADSITAPLGVTAGYAPATIKPLSGRLAVDTLVLAVRPAATASAYSTGFPTDVTNHAGLEWTVANGSVTGNNLATPATVRFSWPAATEVGGPLSNRPRIFVKDGFGWGRYNSRYTAQTNTTDSVRSLGMFAVADDSRPFRLATSVTTPFLCSANDTIVVQALTADTFNVGNVFTFVMSDASGSFSSPLTIGALASRRGGTAKFVVPAGLTFGTNYRVRVSSSDPVMVADSTLGAISIDSLPTKPVITVQGDTVICAGNDLTLTASPAFAYRWSTGATTQSIVINNAGTYTLTVLNSGQCESPVATKTITLAPGLPAPTINVTTGSNTFCDGDSATLEGPTGFTFYRWNNGATTRSIVVKRTGNYNLRVGNALNCLSDTSSSPVTVNVLPKPAKPVITQVGRDSLLATAGAQRYEWYRNGVRVNGVTTSLLRNATTANYRVVAITGFCRSDSSDVFSFVLGAARRLPSHLLTLAPNPTQDVVEISVSGVMASRVDAQVLDATGREVMVQEMAASDLGYKTRIDIGAVPAGLYWVRVTAGNQMVVKQLIKQ